MLYYESTKVLITPNDETLVLDSTLCLNVWYSTGQKSNKPNDSLM